MISLRSNYIILLGGFLSLQSAFDCATIYIIIIVGQYKGRYRGKAL